MIESVHVWLSTVLIILTISGSIWRVAVILNKKADTDKVVLKEVYEKDLKQINADFDDFADDIEDINQWRKEHVDLYHKIDTKLEIIVTKVTAIEKNCDKQACKK